MVSFRGGIKTKPRPDWKGLFPLVLRDLIPTLQRTSPSMSHGSPPTPPPLFEHIVRPGISSVIRAFAQGLWEIAGSIPEEAGPCNTQGNN